MLTLPSRKPSAARLVARPAAFRFRVSGTLSRLRAGRPLLFDFGTGHLIVAMLLAAAVPSTDAEVMGVHAYYKPIKFLLSTWLLAWAMAAYLPLLRTPRLARGYGWVTVVILGLENVYIVGQALRGARSHFNTADWFGPVVFPLMGLAISAFALATLYVGWRFVRLRRAGVSPTLLTGIRWGIFLFVLFAFEGGMIGANGGHTVGAADGGAGLPFLGWSLDHGDLRIAHFVGMHALQVLPLLGAFVLRRRWQVHVAGVGYLALGLVVLAAALAGRGVLA